MKNLTTEEFDKAPKVIQFLHISDISKIEVRNSIVNYPPTPKAMGWASRVITPTNDVGSSS